MLRVAVGNRRVVVAALAGAQVARKQVGKVGRRAGVLLQECGHGVAHGGIVALARILPFGGDGPRQCIEVSNAKAREVKVANGGNFFLHCEFSSDKQYPQFVVTYCGNSERSRAVNRAQATMVAVLLGGLSASAVGAVEPASPVSTGAAFAAVAHTCAPSIDPQTLGAVVTHESAFHPLYIHINGGASLPHQPVNRAQAVATAEYLAAHGYSFDAGIGQVNSANVKHFGATWQTVFEPCGNLQLAAAILRQCYARASASGASKQVALRGALSCYNTGSLTKGKANGYVASVVAAALDPGVHVPAILPLDPKEASAQALRPAHPAQAPKVSEHGTPDVFGSHKGDVFAHPQAGVFEAAETAATQAEALQPVPATSGGSGP